MQFPRPNQYSRPEESQGFGDIDHHAGKAFAAERGKQGVGMLHAFSEQLSLWDYRRSYVDRVQHHGYMWVEKGVAARSLSCRLDVG